MSTRDNEVNSKKYCKIKSSTQWIIIILILLPGRLTAIYTVKTRIFFKLYSRNGTKLRLKICTRFTVAGVDWNAKTNFWIEYVIFLQRDNIKYKTLNLPLVNKIKKIITLVKKVQWVISHRFALYKRVFTFREMSNYDGRL